MFHIQQNLSYSQVQSHKAKYYVLMCARKPTNLINHTTEQTLIESLQNLLSQKSTTISTHKTNSF